jgi:hypothetical protein
VGRSRIAFSGLIVSLSLACALTASGADGAARSRPLVKNVVGWVTALAMDGSRVVYATQAFAPTNCFKLFSWNTSTRAGALVSGPKTGSCGSDESAGQRIDAVAVAGSRVAWIRNLTGNSESDDSLFTATVSGTGTLRLLTATRTGDTGGGPLRGTWIGGLVGSGTVLAVNTWRTSATGTVRAAALRRVGGVRLAPAASGASTLTAESADSGRIAVVRTDGSVAIYSAAGAILQTISPGSVKEVALHGDDLAVLTGRKTLELYNAHTGALIRSWPVPAGAVNLGLGTGIAVFSVWRRAYALKLSSGRQALLAAAPRAIVADEIEAPGVVYAYNTIRGLRAIGNIAFLPLNRVQAAL